MIFELVHQKRTQASQLRHCRRKILRNMYALGPERGGCALLAYGAVGELVSLSRIAKEGEQQQQRRRRS